MSITKCISELGRPTRFEQGWPGKRCLAKTRKGTLCQSPAFKNNGRCRLHGGLSTGATTSEGLKRISDANRKHGRYTKENLVAKRRTVAVGRRVKGELKILELKLINAGLISRN